MHANDKLAELPNGGQPNLGVDHYIVYILLTGDSAGEESDALEVEVPDGPEHVALAEGPVGAQHELNETLRVGEADRRPHRHGRHERQRVQLQLNCPA